MPERKKCSQMNTVMGHVRGVHETNERVSMAMDTHFKLINKSAFDDHLNHKTNIHELKLACMNY